MFLDLSPYFLIAFLQEWISVKDFGRLNTAFCNIKHRPCLEHLFVVRVGLANTDNALVKLLDVLLDSKLTGVITMKIAFKYDGDLVENQWNLLEHFRSTEKLNVLVCFFPQ